MMFVFPKPNRNSSKACTTVLHDHDDDGDERFYEDGSQSSSSSSPSSSKEGENSNSKSTGLSNSPSTTIAGKETTVVRRFRFFLYFVLFAFMVMASVGIYWYVRTDQTSKFEEEFRSKGTTIVSRFNDDSVRILQSLETLSTAVTTQALNANMSWPCVTLPNSARMLEPYLVANLASLVIMPKVEIRQRTKWEHYAQKEKGWIENDLKAREAMMYEEVLEQLQREEEQERENALYHERLEGHDDDSFNDTRKLQTLQETPLRRSNFPLQQEDMYVDASGRQLQTVTEDRRNDTETEVVSPYIKNYVGVDVSKGPWVVWWQYTPVIPNRWFLNFNRLAFEGFYDEVQAVWKGEAVISSAWTYEPGLDFQSTRDFIFLQELLVAGGNGRYQPGEPIGFIHYPVFDKFGVDRVPAAVLTATIYWKTYFLDVLPEYTKPIVCVVENSLGQSFSYQVAGNDTIFLGAGDLHDPRYDHLELAADYSRLSGDMDKISHDYTGVPLDDQYISYSIRVYPTSEMQDVFVNNEPTIFLVSIMTGFCVVIAIFIFYDRYVERRQRIVWESAVRSGKVVSNLFPEHLRERVMEQSVEVSDDTWRAKQHFRNKDMNNEGASDGSRPIADLYIDTTVLYAQITNFTAWSSVREPFQVFSLLETIYREFDKIAGRRRVFKVETVQDCYVACAGIPKPRKDHAVIMARFAHDIIRRMQVVSKQLEVTLGPDTGDLQLRVGIHSGPVTAGVFRGERARFQLFGQTMDKCSVIQQTGFANEVHCSKETAALIKASGKDSWLVLRGDAGKDQTYFVKPQGARARSVSSVTSHHSESSQGHPGVDVLAPSQIYGVSLPGVNEKTERLICWNVEMLLELLKLIAAARGTTEISSSSYLSDGGITFADTPLEEVKEIIALPDSNGYNAVEKKIKPSSVKIPPQVVKELHHLVSTIALLYKPNPFHNFEHASHVVMSVIKLMSRITSSSHTTTRNSASGHHNSYGITSDPLTQFACAFSALIHDADHEGVSNAQLVKEQLPIASKYKERSVAEQNSLDLCWELLFRPDYSTFRAFLLPSKTEITRFRHLVVNSVMATDIVDKDLKALRNGRWDKAFKGNNDVGVVDDNPRDSVNRKATIVIEHIIQASDISHTMQHFDIYLKWNKNLFMELYKAYKAGRMEKDPAEFWFKGEFGFFDFYIIPLTQKLKECGVFGVSSDEYLNYAHTNREMWEHHGEQAVAEFIREAKQLYDKNEALPELNEEDQMDDEADDVSFLSV